jgi:short subunit fatty acids transporter
MKRGNKRGIVTEYLPWILIALLVLVIVIIAIAMFKEKGFTFIDQIKNFFRGG